jgi:hypothetical protein
MYRLPAWAYRCWCKLPITQFEPIPGFEAEKGIEPRWRIERELRVVILYLHSPISILILFSILANNDRMIRRIWR